MPKIVFQGGNMLHGMMMGAVSKAGGYGVDTYASGLGMVGALIANSALSGVIDELGGGKFANGAITGAFAYLFNEKLHGNDENQKKMNIWDKDLKEIFEKYAEMSNFVKEHGAAAFYEKLGGPLGEWAGNSPESFSNTCAAKLSYALNYSGFEIPHNARHAYLAGDGKYYIISAKHMFNYLKKTFNRSDTRKYHVMDIRNSIIYQPINQGGISGHVDVIYRNRAAGKKYTAYDTFVIGK